MTNDRALENKWIEECSSMAFSGTYIWLAIKLLQWNESTAAVNERNTATAEKEEAAVSIIDFATGWKSFTC